jgi:hypothetical protein
MMMAALVNTPAVMRMPCATACEVARLACTLGRGKPPAGGLAAQLLKAVGRRPIDTIRIAVDSGYVNLSGG